MKTMTCKELGGPCDQKPSGGSWEEMVQTMVKHVMSNHPETAKEMEKMHGQDPKKWGREMKPKCDAAPAAQFRLRQRAVDADCTCDGCVASVTNSSSSGDRLW